MSLPAADRSLEDILEAVSRGNRQAFHSLYKATAPKLFGLVLRITQNRGTAEDILQETYVKIWRNAGRYSPGGGQAIMWLRAIARNCAFDRIRADKVQRSRIAEIELDSVFELVAAPVVEDVVLQQTLRFCLLQLSVEARRCVVLAYCWGFSREELAAHFGRPVGTIKTLLHRSLIELRACLELP